MKVNEPVRNLIGVGPKMGEKLERLGIENIRDLLFYYPRKYDDFTKPQKISTLRINDVAIIRATIIEINEVRTKRRWMSLIKAKLADESGEIEAVWFNQAWLKNILRPLPYFSQFAFFLNAFLGLCPYPVRPIYLFAIISFILSLKMFKSP